MRKLLLRIIFGFILGVSLLTASHIATYYAVGQEAFNSAVTQLMDINVFQKQVLVVGLAGSLLLTAFYVVEDLMKKDKPSIQRVVASVISFLIIAMLSILLIGKTGVLDKTVENMLIIIGCFFVMVYGLFHCIKSAIDDFIINEKIKEKNNI